MNDRFPPYPGDSVSLNRFRRERNPFFTLGADPAPAVVLGCGTPPQPDLRLEHCLADGIPVYRRRGGGGAVVLGRGTVVITGCFPAVPGRFPDDWLDRIVTLLQEALRGSSSPGSPGQAEAVAPPLGLRGLGDLCLVSSVSGEERKILGSSLYLARDVVLYQGSLLYRADLSLLPRYLGSPSRVPDYRRSRTHLDFVTNLAPAWQLDLRVFETRLHERLGELAGGTPDLHR